MLDRLMSSMRHFFCLAPEKPRAPNNSEESESYLEAWSRRAQADPAPHRPFVKDDDRQ